MRLERQHVRADLTTLIKRRKGTTNSQLNSLEVPLTPPSGPPAPGASPLPLPGQQPNPSMSSSPDYVGTPSGSNLDVAPDLAPAAEPAQDTTMMRKVNMGRAAMLLTLAFVASRVLGLVRTALFATTFGTGQTSDAFVQASLLPDTIFNIVAGGALSSAFIPIFTKYKTEHDEKTAWHIADTSLTLATLIMVMLALIGTIFANPLVALITPNYRNDPNQIALIANLMRIMFIQAIILGGGVIVNAVLNAQQNFQLPAIGTVLYNVGNIAGLVPGFFLALIGRPNYMLAVFCASFGVVLGAALQIGVQVRGLKKVGMHYKPAFDWRHPGVIQIGRQMVPRIFNASVFSFTAILDRFLIGLLAVVATAKVVEGLTTQYYQAYQLMLLPLGVFGMAMTTAAFPTLAEYFARGRLDRVREIILDTLRSILFLSVPSSIGLIVLALPIIQTLLAHGHYTLDNAKSTAIPLAFFAVGLGGLAAIEILTRSFYAMRDSRTPVIISIGQFALKVALGLILLNPFTAFGGVSWGMGALAFSTSIASVAEAVVLFFLLEQRLGDMLQRSLGVFMVRLAIATGIMGVSVLITRILLDLFLNTSDSGRTHVPFAPLVTIIKLAIELFVGIFVYLRAAHILKLEELGPIRRLLARFRLTWLG